MQRHVTMNEINQPAIVYKDNTTAEIMFFADQLLPYELVHDVQDLDCRHFCKVSEEIQGDRRSGIDKKKDELSFFPVKMLPEIAEIFRRLSSGCRRGIFLRREFLNSFGHTTHYRRRRACCQR